MCSVWIWFYHSVVFLAQIRSTCLRSLSGFFRAWNRAFLKLGSMLMSVDCCRVLYVHAETLRTGETNGGLLQASQVSGFAKTRSRAAVRSRCLNSKCKQQILFQRKASPNAKAKIRQRMASPNAKANTCQRMSTPEAKAKTRQRMASPNAKAKTCQRMSTPEAKAKTRQRMASLNAKAKTRQRMSTPEAKAKTRQRMAFLNTKAKTRQSFIP